MGAFISCQALNDQKKKHLVAAGKSLGSKLGAAVPPRTQPGFKPLKEVREEVNLEMVSNNDYVA